VAAIALLLALMALVACSGDDGGSGDGGDRPTVAVSTTILADVVTNIVGEWAEVVTIMAAGTDPHGFQPSAREAQAVREADALVINGAGLEEALRSLIDGARAEGVPTHEAISAVAVLPLPGGTDRTDPHFFTDPRRMVDAVDGIAAFLAEAVPALGGGALDGAVARYRDRLTTLDADVEQVLAGIDPQRRVLITSHEVFAYFADRYRFEVVGVVISGGSTGDASSAAELARLAEVIRTRRVPAVFTDASSPSALADTLAREVGGSVAVVELFTESLGPPGSGGATYEEVVRTNAARIAEVLG
jgi:zinc/manganese transport system substrate-binding protein